MYVFIGYDSPQGPELRKIHREAHLAKLRDLAKAGKIELAGPFGEAPCGFAAGGGDASPSKGGAGSLIVFNAATRTEVELIAKTDPYVMHRVFERYEIRPFEKVLP